MSAEAQFMRICGDLHPLGLMSRAGALRGAVATLFGSARLPWCPGRCAGSIMFHHQIYVKLSRLKHFPLKHFFPFQIQERTRLQQKAMSGSATPPPAAAASGTPTVKELTPDSLCEQSFERDMERIFHYQTKFPRLDTVGMIAKAMAERDARKQVAFDEKMKWSLQAHAPRTEEEAHSDDDDGASTEAPRYRKRKRASPGSTAKPAGKKSALALTEKFLSRIERQMKTSTTRCA